MTCLTNDIPDYDKYISGEKKNTRAQYNAIYKPKNIQTKLTETYMHFKYDNIFYGPGNMLNTLQIIFCDILIKKKK